MLDAKYKKLASKLDDATDELLAWKLHDQRERITETNACSCGDQQQSNEKRKNASQDKPDMKDNTRQDHSKENANCDLLFIGTSLVKGIKPDKLLPSLQTHLHTKYHISEAATFIQEYRYPEPRAVILQEMSNDIKDKSKDAQQCTEELVALVEQIRVKFTNAKIILSLPPG